MQEQHQPRDESAYIRQRLEPCDHSTSPAGVGLDGNHEHAGDKPFDNPAAPRFTLAKRPK